MPLTVKRVPLGSIHLDPANVRLHDERNLESIKGSLARFGQQKPIVVDHAGTIRAGNGTFAAAKALGWPEIDVVETDLEGIEAVAYAIADNRTSDLSSFDDEALAKLLVELREQEALPGSGFEDTDLDRLLMELGQDLQDVVQDEVPLAPENPVTRPGDLWTLGRHRLLCGDSASAADVDRLLAGASIHLVNTDPPYNVKVEPRSNNAIAAGLSSFTSTHHQGLDLARHPGKAKPTHERLRPKDRPLENDFVSDEEFARLLRAWFGNLARVLLPGRGFYIWGGYSNLGNYPPALAESGLYFSQAIIWDKQHPVLTRKDFLGCFEVCYYGWREGAAHEFFGPPNVQDLWHVKKVNPQSMIHLTENAASSRRRRPHGTWLGLCSTLFSVACGAGSGGLEGKYFYAMGEPAGEGMTLELRQGGVAEATRPGGRVQEGTYRAEGGRVTVSLKGDGANLVYTLESDGNLTTTFYGSERAVFVKQ